MIDINILETGKFCSRPELSKRRDGNGVAGRSFGATARLANPMVPAASAATGAAAANGSTPARRSAAQRVEKALDYMWHHMDQPLPMAAISKLAGVSTSAFYSLFKLATGYTPNDFFTRVRMQHAGRLLLESDLSVKEVATRLGYDDPFYFSRVFKLVHGIAPSQFRAGRANLNGRHGLLLARSRSAGWPGRNGRNTLVQAARSQ